MEFTYVKEVNNELSFLDVKVSLLNAGFCTNKATNMCRRETLTGVELKYDSSFSNV